MVQPVHTCVWVGDLHLDLAGEGFRRFGDSYWPCSMSQPISKSLQIVRVGSEHAGGPASENMRGTAIGSGYARHFDFEKILAVLDL